MNSIIFQLFLTICICMISGNALSQAADYIGSASCRQCHQEEFEQWQGSHHQLAMAKASTETVLGDFDNAEFLYNGITSRFFVDDSIYKVETDNAAGEMEIFEVAYTFGWEPLQQYLVEFSEGRLQALNIAWDSRSDSEGGQRWFHLYPDESVHSGDALHWTQYGMNWNTNCAECHSTNLQKNYQPESNSFATTWDEISVGCEACHGPGGEHIAWTKNPVAENTNKGFSSALIDAELRIWTRALDQDTAALSSEYAGLPQEQQVCASCHSRRFQWQPDTDSSFVNNHQLQLIEPGLYHEDGQILSEVYVYGSYLQSKMHGAGVTCSNCHNPHTAEVKVEGNGLCLQCHSPVAFNTPEHHLHPANSDGALCVNCHMPETTYMVVDPRRDHSIRIPRPDLSIDTNIPNACNQCHMEEPAIWASDILEEHFGQPERNTAESLAGIWGNDTNSLNRLFRIIREDNTPSIIHASAIRQLQQFTDPRAANAAINALRSESSMDRSAAIAVLSGLSPQERFQYLYPLLEDENIVVRQQATANLADIPLDQLPPELRQTLNTAFSAYEANLLRHLDNPAIAVQLAGFYVARGRYNEAINTYSQARVIQPKFLPALMNMADLYRILQEEQKAIETLIEAESIDNTLPDIKYALGLAYVRSQDRSLALSYFEKATQLRPDHSDYRYAWALTLFETGNQNAAIEALLEGLNQAPEDQQLLYALGYFYEQTGNLTKATESYQLLLSINANHQGAAQQLRNILENNALPVN